jgi:hypothetical protein
MQIGFSKPSGAICVGDNGGCPSDAPCTEEIDGVEYCSACCIPFTNVTPTLNEWGLITLTSLLALTGILRLRMKNREDVK